MLRAVVISGEPKLTVALARMLARAEYEVLTTTSLEESAEVVPAFRPDVALIDRQLPNNAFSVLVRLLRTQPAAPACLVISEPSSPGAILAAIRAGACDWIDKPVNEQELMVAVRRANENRRFAEPRQLVFDESESHASTRLADKVALFVAARGDGPTLREFGRIVGISTGGLRNWCRTAGIGAREFLKFARGLRAVVLHEREPSAAAADLLDLVDRRTLVKFVAASGGAGLRMPGTVDEFLRQQRFIAKPAFVRAVRNALSRSAVVAAARTSGNPEAFAHQHLAVGQGRS
jgi:FixJ family two-component response regulator